MTTRFSSTLNTDILILQKLLNSTLHGQSKYSYPIITHTKQNPHTHTPIHLHITQNSKNI